MKCSLVISFELQFFQAITAKVRTKIEPADDQNDGEGLRRNSSSSSSSYSEDDQDRVAGLEAAPKAAAKDVDSGMGSSSERNSTVRKFVNMAKLLLT